MNKDGENNSCLVGAWQQHQKEIVEFDCPFVCCKNDK